mmetsp:Transcript_66573/g.124227  ORF Transcript_66573/g.124227 Transcript_66573/m.124227 type:complete len:135 (-) Transcript_66573:45-449(-)
MGVRSVNHIKITKKRTKKFKRHFSDRFMRVSESWRKPRGIDSVVRRKFRGNIKMVNIGYGNNKKTRHLIPGGFKKFLISNADDLELLLMNNRTFAGELAHNLSAQKRVDILNRAKELNVKITNPEGRTKKAPKE